MSQRNERSMPSNSSSLTHWLIHQAAHRAPEDLSSRLEEEWLADLESRSAVCRDCASRWDAAGRPW